MRSETELGPTEVHAAGVVAANVGDWLTAFLGIGILFTATAVALRDSPTDATTVLLIGAPLPLAVAVALKGSRDTRRAAVAFAIAGCLRAARAWSTYSGLSLAIFIASLAIVIGLTFKSLFSRQRMPGPASLSASSAWLATGVFPG